MAIAGVAGRIVIRDYRDSDFLDVKQNLEEGGLFYPKWDGEESLRKIRRNQGFLVASFKKQMKETLAQ